MTHPSTTHEVSVTQPGSSSLQSPDYWWYRARSRILEAAFAPYVCNASRVLDVGSADGPSVGWLRGTDLHVTVDVVPTGLKQGSGVCASALQLPFPDESFEVVSAFDVVEHLDPEAAGLHQLARVLVPGGRLLLAVPAYQWAWSDHDVRAGHYRRYTRGRLLQAVTAAGLMPLRASYAFTSVFPFFVAERGLRRIRGSRGAAPSQLTPVPPRLDRLLVSLSDGDARWLQRSRSLPFGSSVLVAATKPATFSDSGTEGT